jgi:glucokinase
MHVGIDLGGTKIHGAIADRDGEILAESRLTTTGDVLERVAELERRLAEAAGTEPASIVTTVVGGAGIPAASGGFALNSNVDLADASSFGSDLCTLLGHSVIIENDVNVAAIGELHYGIGTRFDDFVVVASGTGIGMGVVVDRRLVRGTRGAAGEIGFLPLGTDPFDPANQRRGPFEEAVAGDALQSRFAASDPRALTPPEIFDLSGSDTAAASAVEEHARLLALGLLATRAVLDPSAVVLMGGIGSRDELLQPLRRWLSELGAADLLVERSALGARGPVLGALHLARSSAEQDGLLP